VKLKDGVAFLGARPSNPTLWMVSQDVRTEGHRIVTLHCRRKESSYGQSVEPGWQRVVQVDLEVDGVGSTVGSRSISWAVEYPGIRAGNEETETHIHLAQKDLVGIVPLAMCCQIQLCSDVEVSQYSLADEEEFGLCKIIWRLHSKKKFSAEMVGKQEKLCAFCVSGLMWEFTPEQSAPVVVRQMRRGDVLLPTFLQTRFLEEVTSSPVGADLWSPMT
ncbi:hypothetical protein QQF64_031812, partial [Cirrhinus molitorella]